MQRAGELGRKLRVRHRRWRSRIDGAGKPRRRDRMRNQANEIVALNPAHPLPARADRAAKTKLEGQQEPRQHAALSAKHQPDAQPHNARAEPLRTLRGALPGLADPMTEAALAAVELGELFILPEAVPADGGAADEHRRPVLEPRDQAHDLTGDTQPRTEDAA